MGWAGKLLNLHYVLKIKKMNKDRYLDFVRGTWHVNKVILNLCVNCQERVKRQNGFLLFFVLLFLTDEIIHFTWG